HTATLSNLGSPPFPSPSTTGGRRPRCEKKRGRRRDVGDDGGGALLARGGDDLHRLLQHLHRAGEELPQGALQVRGHLLREGLLLRRQVGRRQAGEAQ
ncbi:ATP synthase subunit epsilon, mitochondrial, partial [Dichanthelium oligosanthes]